MSYRSVKKIIANYGWVEIRCCGSHHSFKKSGVDVIVTINEHGSKDLTIGVIKDIERKTGLHLK